MNMKTFYLISVVFFILLTLFFVSANSKVVKSITAEELYKLLNDDKTNDVVLIDVRTKEEFNNGHINKAINIDYYSKDFKEKLSKLDKKKSYVLYCRSGNRSGKSALIMEQLGFKTIYDMGGINKWIEAGYSIVK